MASPITPVLKSSARSAYRALFRASGTTFAGDDRVLYAFRDKVRTETVAGRQEVDPVEYEARVKHAFEVADVLKKNVVQAEKQGEGEHTAWKLRMTSDTELGSNEGVKAPYSRPTRGEPRLKCGEDPNAVAPLPPRSLQHMVSNSTRSHSPTASSSSSPPDPNPTPAEQEYEYDRLRVQAVRNRLNQVNIRVSASPTGREFMTERILVEDKLSALVARMEFLASDMHDKLYPPSSNSAPAQTLVELLLDHLPISPQSNVDPVGPPVQLRQYIRFLQSAAKHTIALRNETLSLMPEIRIAIAELVETPSPGTRSPNNAIDSLRAIQWRLLMIKRGIQGIAKSRRVFYSKTATMLDALRLAMANVSYAHDCVEDLEMNGPRVEDARSLVEEIEKSAKGSYLPDLRKEMERRLQAGVAWKRVEETMISHGLSPTLIYLTRKVYHRIRQYEENYPRVLDFVAKAQRKGDIEGAKRWRRKPFTRSQRLLNTMQGHMETFNIALNRLIARHPQNDEKAGFLHKAKQALDLSMDVTSEHIVAIRNQAEHATWLEWASTVATRLDLVGELVERTVAADRYLEQYIRGEPGGWELDVGEKDLFFDARTQLIIIYDVAWRLEKRMKQDVEDLREVSVLLCEEGQSDFEDLRTFTGWHKRVKAKFSSWEGREYNAQRSPSDGNRAVRSRPEDASPINASKSFFALDE